MRTPADKFGVGGCLAIARTVLVATALASLCGGCTAEQWQALAQGLEEGSRSSSKPAPSGSRTAATTSSASSDSPQTVDALLASLNASELIFEEINWHRLRGRARTLQNWRIV